MISFSASVLRYCPDPLSAEFANVAIFFAERSPQGAYTRLVLEFPHYTERLSSFFANDYRRRDWTPWRRAILDNFERLERSSRGEPLLANATPFEEILRRVSPPGFSSFRWARPFTAADQTLEQAVDYWIARLVLQNNEGQNDESLSDEELWNEQRPRIELALEPALRANLVRFDYPVGDQEPESFRMVWRNGTLQALDVLSFGFKTAKTIKIKEQRTIGKLWSMQRRVADLSCSLLVSRPADEALVPAFNRATEELRTAPTVKRVLEPDALNDFLAQVLREARPLSQ